MSRTTTLARKPFDDILSLIKAESTREADPDIVAKLREVGKKVIMNAYKTRATKEDLGNQIDAYGFGVFYNGKLVAQGYLDSNKSLGFSRRDHQNKDGTFGKGALPDRKRNKRGRIEALHAVQKFVPSQPGYVLYIVNSMWYSSIHESWGLPIISQALFNGAAEMGRVFKIDSHDINVDFYDYGY